jgi:DNA-binding transcriptional ArsR family regulator
MPKHRTELGVAEAALLFAALGDETRLALLERLSRKGPASIAQLSENAEVTRQAITKHLQTLAAAGVVQGTRSGREHQWRLNPERLADAQHCLAQVGRFWDDALSRLKARIEVES